MNSNLCEWIWRILPGTVAALTVATLNSLGWLVDLEQLLNRNLVQLRGRLPADSRVVVVAIDDQSIQKFGRFPWPRQYYIELLKILAREGDNVVALNILLSEPTPQDPLLASAMLNHGLVVLAMGWDAAGKPLQPVPTLAVNAVTTGHILNRADTDGITRQVELFSQGEVSLAFAAVQAYSVIQPVGSLPDQKDHLIVNWAASNVVQYSFADVIQGKVPPQSFQNKIVLVGVTATGISPMVTPFEDNPPASGVILQATVVNNLLASNWLHPLSFYWLLVIFLLGGPGFSLVLSRWHPEVQFFVWIGLCVGWGGVSLIFLSFNYRLPTAMPIVLLSATTGAVVLGEQWRMNSLLQKQVQHLWQTHHQDLVANNRVSSPTLSYQLPLSMQRVTQLSILAEQFGRSQSAQAAIARSLSLGLIAADLDGYIWFCNPVAATLLQIKVGDFLQPNLSPRWLTAQQWQHGLSVLRSQHSIDIQEVQQGDRWFEIKLEPLFYQIRVQGSDLSAPIDGLLILLEEITARKQAAIAQAQLNQRLLERTMQLESVNKELETFNYAVSHDLRAPLWRIDGFSRALLEDNGDQLDQIGQDYLLRIRTSVQRMGDLIEDLLKLSRINNYEMNWEWVDISSLVLKVLEELQQSQPERQIDIQIAPEIKAKGDRRLLTIALENLLSNAWKFTSRREQARIEFGMVSPPQINQSLAGLSSSQDLKIFVTPTYFVRDNGAGFDMNRANRLFGAFQRFHNASEFPGTGVGLMTTQRIIHRHQGRIWAEAAVDRGATFYFTLSE